MLLSKISVSSYFPAVWRMTCYFGITGASGCPTNFLQTHGGKVMNPPQGWLIVLLFRERGNAFPTVSFPNMSQVLQELHLVSRPFAVVIISLMEVWSHTCGAMLVFYFLGKKKNLETKSAVLLCDVKHSLKWRNLHNSRASRHSKCCTEGKFLDINPCSCCSSSAFRNRRKTNLNAPRQYRVTFSSGCYRYGLVPSSSVSFYMVLPEALIHLLALFTG